jgi:hypothetical protein
MSEEKLPTREELIASLKEMIEVKELQAQLQELNAKIAGSRAEELRAIVFIEQMTNPKEKGNEYKGGGMENHVVTQEDLDNNPEMAEAGIEVGMEILVPKSTEPKKLKKK